MGAWLLRHQRSLLFLLTLLALAGIFAIFHLPVALFPDMQFPRIVVSVASDDRPASQMVTQVTEPLEQVLENVPSVSGIKSVTGRGAVDLSLTFDWGVNMVTAALQVESAVNQILPQLSSDTTFTITRMDPASRQMMGFSLISSNPDPVRLRDFAYTNIRPLFATVPGIARVEILGGKKPEYQVVVNPVKLASYGLTLANIDNALANTNVLASVGKLEDRYQLFLVLANHQLKNLQDIKNVPIPVGNNGLVRLGDIAEVKLATEPSWTDVNANGHNAVLINLYQQENANTVAIVHEINHRLTGFRSTIPKNMHLSLYYDQSQLILDSANSVRDAIIMGAFLAGIILFIFLRNVRMMAIIAMILPTVLLITALLLYILGMSFNIMTLGGMAAAVGLIIDDGVVILEHITRRLAEVKENIHQSVVKASLEMLRPLAGSSLATMIIFLPLAFLRGFTGAFFTALAVTMATALIISFFVVVLAVPLLGELLIRRKDATKLEHIGHRLATVHRQYQRIMTLLFSKQHLLCLGLVLFIGVGIICFIRIGTGFLPPVDEGGFVLDYRTPPGTSLTETNRLLMQAEKIIQANKDIDGYSRRTGLQMGGGLTEPDMGDIYIHLKPFPRKNVHEVMNDITNAINANVPGLTVVDTIQLMEDMIGDLTDTPQPVEIKIYGNNQTELENLAGQISHIIKDIPGITDVNSGIVVSGGNINIHINPAKTAMYGMTVKDISEQINNTLGGSVVTTIPANDYSIGVRVTGQKSIKDQIGILHDLPIITPKGNIIPLESMARFELINGQAEINRENLQQMIAVTSGIQGRDTGSVMKDVRAAVGKIALSPQFSIQYGGLYQEQQQSFHDLMLVFIAALMLIILLLLFLYECFLIVLSILSTILLTLPGIFLGLWLTNTELDVSSIMGMTMILGIVTEIAIFYFAELVNETHIDRQELIQAGVMRMRPILMTAIIAILALLPLAFGDTLQTPLAIAIIAGLLFSLPLVLFVMPVLYKMFSQVSNIP